MFTEIQNIQRHALKTEIKTDYTSDCGVTYFSILVETSSRMALYNVIIKTFIVQLQKSNRGCKIQIITYGDSVSTISEFSSEPNELKGNLKDIKFSKDNDEAKLGEALNMCFKNIESDWSSDLVSKIIVISSGQSTDDSSDDLVDILSLENNEIYGLAGGCSTNPDEALKDLQSLLPDQKVIPLGKNPTQDIKLLMSDGVGCNSELGNHHSTNCPINIEVYPHSNETKSIKEDLVLDIVVKPDGNTSSAPAGTKINFLPNKYYSGYTFQLKQNLVFGEPYEETIRLEFRRGQVEKVQFENFPSKINFTIELPNDKSNIHQGSISLNISYFLGELKSKYRCCIGVEGEIGNGKSTCLNGFVNLFNPGDELEEYFNANCSSGSHVTTKINNISLKEILSSKHYIHPVQESFCDIDIAWSDAWGFVDSDVVLKFKAEGRVHHGAKKGECSILQPEDRYRIDCFVFVVSIRNFAQDSSIERIEKKVREVIDLGITPLLAITFTDVLSKNQLKEIMGAKVRLLSVQECNTFIINNYTEKETHKDISKDVQYLRLLTKAVQLCKIKNERDSINRIKGISNLSIKDDGTDSYQTPSKNQTSSLFFESSYSQSPILFKSPQQTHSTTTIRSPDSVSSETSTPSNKRINVMVDVVPDLIGTVLTTFEIESFENESISDLKCKLINEIDPEMNTNDWNITKDTGTVLFESAKLSSVIKSSGNLDSVKLILKKKQRILDPGNNKNELSVVEAIRDTSNIPGAFKLIEKINIKFNDGSAKYK
ncbi:hypothetical protein RB653_008757 [Dictyostelium firmibasis]|uniref:VWFA domain-containing protein n=1 Tax=Dictyostelium firmibasis TaxID=79012 RepID=A0AAN7UD46_9MYCE